MSTSRIQLALNDIERNMSDIAPYRKSELFNEFLVRGYTAITLDSVPASAFFDLLRAKICLGALITLYDDLADRPTQANPQLLEALYRLRFGKVFLSTTVIPRDQQVLDFAHSLFVQIEAVLQNLPHYQRLSGLLSFDLAQFYSANQYSSLLTATPWINNRLENRLYAHHNMGMIMVALMDLMAIENVNFSEFGAMREVYLMGQRMGRIFNVLATHKRETADGDVTGELPLCSGELEIHNAKRRLRQEIQILSKRIVGYETRITSFSVKDYLEGLMTVQKLHEKMEGIL